MASKRLLKRDLNEMVFDIVEECYTVSLFDDSKSGDAEQIIDEAADFQDDMLTQINAAKNKKDFAPIREKIEQRAIEFVEKLNKLN